MGLSAAFSDLKSQPVTTWNSTVAVPLLADCKTKDPLIWSDSAVEAEEEVVVMVQIFGKSLMKQLRNCRNENLGLDQAFLGFESL